MGSPALSMKAAPLRLRTNGNPLENADRCAGWRPWIIESAGEPVNGTKSSELFGTLHAITWAVDWADLRDKQGFKPYFQAEAAKSDKRDDVRLTPGAQRGGGFDQAATATVREQGFRETSGTDLNDFGYGTPPDCRRFFRSAS